MESEPGDVSRRGRVSDLARLAAEQVAASLRGLPVGSPLSLTPGSDLCPILELLIPKWLCLDHSEWERESLDGFLFSRTTKLDEQTVGLSGVCILITDQTVTPFAATLAVSDARALAAARIQLGEPGAGLLGISGPAWCQGRLKCGPLLPGEKWATWETVAPVEN